MKNLVWGRFSLAVFVMMLFSNVAVAQLEMVVSNVEAVQRPFSSLVDITYDLATLGYDDHFNDNTIENLPVWIGLEFSFDGGATYVFQCQAVSGDVGAGIMPAIGLTITWDADSDIPGFIYETCRFRVVAEVSTYTVSGTLTFPEPVVDKAWYVAVDVDGNGGNGMLGWTEGIVTGSTVSYTIPDIPEGDYYIYSEVDLVGNPGLWDCGDYVGSGCWVSGWESCTVMVNSSMTVDVELLVYELENPFENAVVGTDSTLEVMTWNLEHFAKNGDTTIELVIQAIEALDVDIIALQEIESEARFEEVLAGLDGYDGWKASSAGYNIDLALIYRTNSSLVLHSIYEIFQDAWQEFPRSPLVMEFLYDGEEFVVINNHLKCCGDNVIDENDSGDEETRRRDACRLLEETIESQYAGKHVIVVGDFNDALDDEIENNVFQNFIDAPADWLFVDMAIAEGPYDGWSFPSWPAHLDHILINQPLFEAADGPDASIQVIPLHSFLTGGWEQYDQDISDHLPVVLKLMP